VSDEAARFDVLVVGGGPAGAKAAVQAAKAGRRVGLVEREAHIGGECVHRGTIPSKTLRETASCLSGLRKRSGGLLGLDAGVGVEVDSLMTRLKSVLAHEERYLADQLARNGIEQLTGVARFRSPSTLEVVRRAGGKTLVQAGIVVIATGSRPRSPASVPVDHEHVLDSDSILSLRYLPRSLVVLGGGVIACEFASIFAALGTEVTLVEKRDRPLGFLDRSLTDRFVAAFESDGGRFLAGASVESVRWDGMSRVVTRLADGSVLCSEKLLCALGRVANVAALDLAAAGLALDERGLVPVDEHYRTAVPHVYAVGDVIGPPALAATGMSQGRLAVRHALGLESEGAPEVIPIGIYTIPEIASVGESERQVTDRLGGAIVGRAQFDEIARAHINGSTDGLLELVCDPEGRRVLGAQAIGEGACDLVHLAQLAIHAGLEVDAFLENVFNFPTLAEAYRVAALDVGGRRARLGGSRAA